MRDLDYYASPLRDSGLLLRCCVLSGLLLLLTTGSAPAETNLWRVGTASAQITPRESLWMGGFAARTRPAEGTLDELWVKALALEALDGGLALMVTADLVGIPKWLYDRLCLELERRYGLRRSQIRLASSHTHSGPVLNHALWDIYPLDDPQKRLIDDYSKWLEQVLLETAGRALASRTPATLWRGQGQATFALNRRTNNEAELEAMRLRGETPKGPSDFAVPVLAVRSPDGALRAVVCGYAAHTSALTQNYLWSADYAGVAQRALESRYGDAMAFFWQGCGSDQSAAPRGTVERCRQLGEELATSVAAVIDEPMAAVPPRLRTAIEFVRLDFGEQPSRAELETAGQGTDYRARWARRLLAELAAGRQFETAYREYPVQAWHLGGDLLWIALGGEVCVDYALRFKREYGPATWVTGYANDVMAYIPSRRLWEEGGYQAGAFEVYGLPATRWCADIEERIAGAVGRGVGRVAPLKSLRAPPQAISSPLELQQRITQELRVTRPDYVVFVPSITDDRVNDTGNEHFLVFDGPDGSLMAVWTQSSAETQPDQHIAFSRSTDEGITWSRPQIIAGPRKPGQGHMASWGYPLVSQSGRIYVLYSQHIGQHDNFVHHTGWLHGVSSDDLGQTWSAPENISLRRSVRDNPDTNMPPNMLCWQKPLRLARDGKYLAGFTRWTSFAVRPNPTRSWTSADSRVEFMRFENVDEDPAVRDLRISWLAADQEALAVPFPGHPEVSACQEPSVVRLPDGRLFCVMRTAAGSPFWSMSMDVGETWTPPRRLLRKDGGEPLLHPLSPCPMYDVKGNTAGSGRYALFIHNHDGHYQGYGPADTGFHRRPVYLVPGRFQAGADQPVWFDEPRFYMDHGGVSLGKPGTAGRLDLALYASFTVRQTQPVLWYPDRKFFLLGRKVSWDGPEF